MKLRIPFAIAVMLMPLTALAACGSANGGGATAGHHAGQVIAPASPRVASRRALYSTSQRCGAGAAETLARTVGLVARRIYANELGSAEVFKDKHQVESYGPLLSALESGNRAAIREAVTRLVYSHTHIVRLRVTRGSEVLADVGGPQILAPAGGTLRQRGRTLGRYLLSVQDDLGYVKLVSRFIGVKLVLNAGGHALSIEGAVNPGSTKIAAHGQFTYRGKRYQVFSFSARAFPSGGLRIALLVPVTGSPSHKTCAAIKMAELRRVAERVSHRFTLSPSNFDSYIRATAPLTGGLLYIRAGSHQFAGSSQPGPAKLPHQGTITYRGSSYGASSFVAPSQAGPVRIYQLVHP